MVKPEEVIEKIKAKAQEYAKKHATDSAKAFYVLGKRDAAMTFLAMIQADGLSAVEDVAKEVLKSHPDNRHAKWILETSEWKKTTI